MCQTCSPLCGNCKPATYKPVLCSTCGKATLLMREECLLYLKRPHRLSQREQELLESGGPEAPVCKACGADLGGDVEASIQPLGCRYSGIICGYPCGRHAEDRRPGAPPCKKQVPLGRLSRDVFDIRR